MLSWHNGELCFWLFWSKPLDGRKYNCRFRNVTDTTCCVIFLTPYRTRNVQLGNDQDWFRFSVVSWSFSTDVKIADAKKKSTIPMSCAFDMSACMTMSRRAKSVYKASSCCLLHRRTVTTTRNGFLIFFFFYSPSQYFFPPLLKTFPRRRPTCVCVCVCSLNTFFALRTGWTACTAWPTRTLRTVRRRPRTAARTVVRRRFPAWRVQSTCT